MSEKPNHVQADIAGAMLATMEHGNDAAAHLIATLDESEMRDYLIAAITLGAAMAATETAVILAHNVRTTGPAVAFLAATIARQAEHD